MVPASGEECARRGDQPPSTPLVQLEARSACALGGDTFGLVRDFPMSGDRDYRSAASLISEATSIVTSVKSIEEGFGGGLFATHCQ